MTITPFFRLAAVCSLGLVLFASAGMAKNDTPKPEPLGNDTYRLTHSARFAFYFNTDRLKKDAREDARDFCASLGKEMQEISITSKKASLIHGGFSSATIVFRAVDRNGPAPAPAPAPVAAPAAIATSAPTPALAPSPRPAPKPARADELSDLQMLDHLHARKVLTDAEYAAAKSRLLQQQ